MSVLMPQERAVRPSADTTRPPGWHELLAAVGDSLLNGSIEQATADLDRFEAELRDRDAKSTRPKAALYAEWAREPDLRARLLKIAGGCPACAPVGYLPTAREVW